MNAVWLNDELMVSPAAVVGLVCSYSDDLYMGHWSHERQIDLVLLGGDRLKAWSAGDALSGVTLEAEAEMTRASRALTRAAALAEMERLSTLLWPEPKPVQRVSYIPDLRIYDPELYGLPVCEARSYFGTIDGWKHCNLAAGHPGDHRFGPTFDELHPPNVQCSTTTFGGMDRPPLQCIKDQGHPGHHEYPK